MREDTVMSHTIEGKKKLLGRVRRIAGQVNALERALEEEAGCTAVLHQIAAVRGAMNGLMLEVLEDHIRTHVADPDDDERLEAAEELIGVVRTYLK